MFYTGIMTDVKYFGGVEGWVIQNMNALYGGILLQYSIESGKTALNIPRDFATTLIYLLLKPNYTVCFAMFSL